MGNNSDLAASCGSVNFAASLLPASSPSKARGAASLSQGLCWTMGESLKAEPMINRVCRAASDSASDFGCQSIMAGKTMRSEKGKRPALHDWDSPPSEYLPARRRIGQGDLISWRSQ